jgi:lipopolysaccharide export system permease protein
VNLLDRYLFRSVLFSSAAAVAVFGFVLAIGNFVRDLLGRVLAGQLPLFSAMFVRLVLLLVPFVVSYALPMGVLTGILLTLGRFSADNEITAIRSSGVSVSRLARPVFLLAAIGTAIGLYINFNAMPRVRVEYDRDLSEITAANPLSLIVPKSFIHEFPGWVIYVGEKNGPDVQDFWLWQLDDQQRVVRFIRAGSGHIVYDRSAREFLVTLADAEVQPFDAKMPEDYSSPPPIAVFERSDPIHVPREKVIGHLTSRTKVDWMTYGQLRAEQIRLASEQTDPQGAKKLAQDKMKVAFTIQNKFNMAAAVFSFALVGVPLGIKVSRKETSMNFLVALGLALGWYFLTVMVGWLDQHPEYRPDLLVWAPNLIFAGLGLWLFRRLDHT